MKTFPRDLLRQMTETYKDRMAGTDDFRNSLDSFFFTALRAARESDTLRQFDCFKEAERYLLRFAASNYLSGLMAGISLCAKGRKTTKSAGLTDRRKKNERQPG